MIKFLKIFDLGFSLIKYLGLVCGGGGIFDFIENVLF